MTMRFLDTIAPAPVKGVRKTSEGYLVADAFTVRTGTQVYLGKEVGRPDLDRVTVYRPPEEVFNRDSLSTFAHKPVTVGHPRDLVQKDNWSRHAVGEVSTEALRDGERLKLTLVVKDQSAIDAIESGSHRHLSAGYLSDLEWGDGVAPDGTPYQARQVNIRANHVALVPRGRAGNCYIGDSDWGLTPISDEELTTEQREVPVTTKTIVLGDKAISVAESDAQTLLDHVAELNRKIGERDGELATTKAKIMTDEAFTEAVDRRVKLLDEARAKAPDVDLSKIVTDGDIMRAVVKARHPNLNLDGQSDDYVRGIYSTIESSKSQGTGVLHKDSMVEALSQYNPGALRAGVVNLDAAIKAEDDSWNKSVANINEGF